MLEFNLFYHSKTNPFGYRMQTGLDQAPKIMEADFPTRKLAESYTETLRGTHFLRRKVLVPLENIEIMPFKENVIMTSKEFTRERDIKFISKDALIPFLLKKPPALSLKYFGKYLGSAILVLKKSDPTHVYRKREISEYRLGKDVVRYSVTKGILVPSEHSVKIAKDRASLAKAVVIKELQNAVFYRYQKSEYKSVSWREDKPADEKMSHEKKEKVERMTADLLFKKRDFKALKESVKNLAIEKEYTQKRLRQKRLRWLTQRRRPSIGRGILPAIIFVVVALFQEETKRKRRR